MQTALQKTGKHFENTLSMCGGTSPPISPFSLSHKIVYIVNDANVIEKKSPSSNKNCVATSEAQQTPLNERQTLW